MSSLTQTEILKQTFYSVLTEYIELLNIHISSHLGAIDYSRLFSIIKSHSRPQLLRIINSFQNIKRNLVFLLEYEKTENKKEKRRILQKFNKYKDSNFIKSFISDFNRVVNKLHLFLQDQPLVCNDLTDFQWEKIRSVSKVMPFLSRTQLTFKVTDDILIAFCKIAKEAKYQITDLPLNTLILTESKIEEKKEEDFPLITPFIKDINYDGELFPINTIFRHKLETKKSRTIDPDSPLENIPLRFLFESKEIALNCLNTAIESAIEVEFIKVKNQEHSKHDEIISYFMPYYKVMTTEFDEWVDTDKIFISLKIPVFHCADSLINGTKARYAIFSSRSTQIRHLLVETPRHRSHRELSGNDLQLVSREKSAFELRLYKSFCKKVNQRIEQILTIRKNDPLFPFILMHCTDVNRCGISFLCERHSERKFVPCVNSKCRLSFCTSCSYLAHPNEECKTSDRNPEDETYFRLHVRKCPSCSIDIQKLNGCNHMQCDICKVHFCWICNQIIHKDEVTEHYLFGSCANRIHDYVELGGV